MRDNSFVTVILILALLYIISPIDLIPDVIPVVGWADDLAVGVESGAAALTAIFVRRLQREHSYGGLSTALGAIPANC